MSKPLWDFNYHCHTFRCGHAFGEDEEYVQVAVENGFKILGFSDHIILPGVHEPNMRGDYSMQEDYFASIRSLKERYKDRIEIHLGYEAEWLGREYAEHYRELLDSGEIEYLILGNHCCYQNGSLLYFPSIADRDLMIRMYTSELIRGMESGLFLYVAHPDFAFRWRPEWDELNEQCARAIIETAVRLDLPLEVNMGPARWWNLDDPDRWDHLPYPQLPFWKLAGELGATCIFGIDAHRPEQLIENDFGRFKEFAERCHLKMIDRLDLNYRKVGEKKKH